MFMRVPFARPFFALFFYALALIGGVLGTFLLLVELLGAYRVLGDKFAPIFSFYGVLIVVYICTGALAVAAIGYVIELLAKIEWNTRPKTDEMGYAVEPTPTSAQADKQYYLSEKGRVTGPLNAAELLALYRDGRISIAAQISVEANGQRRLLKNLSEIGL
jgi:hypothetical protein